MRAIVLAICVTTATVAAVFAQSPQPEPERFYPRYAHNEPLPGSFWARNWQLSGLEEAAAVMCCRPRNGGRGRSMDCRLAWESPPGVGFGEAALRVAGHRRRLTKEAHDDYLRLIPGQEFPMVISFNAPGVRGRPSTLSNAEQDRMCGTHPIAAAP